MKKLASTGFIALIAAAACGGGGGGGGDDGGDDGVEPGVDAGVEPDAAVLPVGPGLAGSLLDGQNVVLTGEDVLACMATVCLYGESGADGSFSFEIEPPAAVALKTQPDLSLQPRRGAALCPVSIASDELVDVGPLHCPLLPDGVLFGPPAEDPQTLSAGDGLELTLRRADLTPRVGDVLVDAAARLMPPSQVCSLLVVPDEEIVAVYALHPFAAVSSSPIAVRAPSDLPPDTAVNFRTISEIDGHFSDPIPGRTDGTTAATDPDTGITELTWLVISR
ncbi:MAG TPA: hypothetical protein VNO33_16790 [Kofleriaceae bacterium]|nr:hypothetical protein [Kofleriaceae bacterium]